MAATKAAISFGMVHIPIALHTATQDADIHFNQLCKEDGSRGLGAANHERYCKVHAESRQRWQAPVSF